MLQNVRASMATIFMRTCKCGMNVECMWPTVHFARRLDYVPCHFTTVLARADKVGVKTMFASLSPGSQALGCTPRSKHGKDNILTNINKRKGGPTTSRTLCPVHTAVFAADEPWQIEQKQGIGKIGGILRGRQLFPLFRKANKNR